MKTQISRCICAVWSVFTDHMCLLQPSGYPKRDEKEALPYWVDVQADLCLASTVFDLITVHAPIRAQSGVRLQGDWGEQLPLRALSRPGKPWGQQKHRPRFLHLLKKLILVQNELFVSRNPVKIEQTWKGKILLKKKVVRSIRNATE